jgi:hypothetical protein
MWFQSVDCVSAKSFANFFEVFAFFFYEICYQAPYVKFIIKICIIKGFRGSLNINIGRTFILSADFFFRLFEDELLSFFALKFENFPIFGISTKEANWTDKPSNIIKLKIYRKP